MVAPSVPEPVVVLIGPKGAGKSTIGRALEREGYARFIDVEAIFLGLPAESRSTAAGYARVREMAEQFAGAVILELTGASPEVPGLLGELGRARPLKLVRVDAPVEVCCRRVRERSPEGHLPSDDELVRRVHELGQRLAVRYDAVVDGTRPIDVATLARSVDLRSPPGLRNPAPQ